MPTTTVNDDTKGLLLTLDRGIAVLEQVAREDGGVTAKSLSTTLDINLGTCYQILKTLGRNGYVSKLSGNRFGLGPRVVFLADHYQSAVAPPPVLLEILRELHDDLQESVYVSLGVNHRIQISAYLEGTKAVRVGGMRIGMSDHPHARASGKCFMAYLDEDELDAWVSRSQLERLTPNTITAWDGLLADLRATRQRGYAMEVEEFNEGVACVSAVVVGEQGVPVAAFATSIPASGMASRRDELVARVQAAGREASRSMGYVGPYPPPPA